MNSLQEPSHWKHMVSSKSRADKNLTAPKVSRRRRVSNHPYATPPQHPEGEVAEQRRAEVGEDEPVPDAREEAGGGKFRGEGRVRHRAVRDANDDVRRACVFAFDAVSPQASALE